ncbi:MAG: extracellular solute-binding protein [Patescibacteria group bacterium]
MSNILGNILDWISSNKRFAIILIVFLIFLVILSLILFLTNTRNSFSSNTGLPFQGSSTQMNVNWWVTEDQVVNNDSLSEILGKFREKYPGVNITINTKKDEIQFIEEFLSNPDTQPDLMTINSNLMAFYQKYSMPNQYFKNKVLADYLERSVETVKTNNVFSSEVYGIPMSVDNLQMYMNVNLLNNLSGTKTNAKDWETLKLQAASFDKSKGQTLISMGGGKGQVTNYSDIIGAMMVQRGIYLDSKNKEIDVENMSTVVRDYNHFRQYINQNQNDYDSFKQGKSLYYLDYFSTNQRLKSEAPQLSYEIVDIPKYPGGSNISHSRFFTTMAHKKHKDIEEKKKVLDDLLYYLSTEEAQRFFATKTGQPSANKKVVLEQYDSKTDSDNNRKFFDQAAVSRAILPACPVKYYDVLNSMLLSIQSKGSNPSMEDIKEVVQLNTGSLTENVYTENVCIPYKFLKQ